MRKRCVQKAPSRSKKLLNASTLEAVCRLQKVPAGAGVTDVRNRLQEWTSRPSATKNYSDSIRGGDL